MDKSMALTLALVALKKYYEQLLQSAGLDALDKLEEELNTQPDAESMLAVIKKHSENAFGNLKQSLDDVDKEYQSFKKDPKLMAEAQKYVAEMMGISEEEVKQITHNTEKSDDDDSTKH